MYFDFNKENNKRYPKFKVGVNLKISKYKNVFAKLYVTNWSEEVFVIRKILCCEYLLLEILLVKKFF